MSRRGSRGANRGRGQQQYGRGEPQRQRPIRGEGLPAGSHLGELGEEQPEIDLAFSWFGADIRVNPDLSDLTGYDFAERALEVGEDSPEAVVMVKESIREYIHPDDFATFWAGALEHRYTTEKLMKVMHQIVEAITGRPTGALSDSSAGQRRTPATSTAAVSERVKARFEAEGRPDLALVVLQAEESRQEQATG